VEVQSGDPNPIRDHARMHLEQLAGVKGGRGIDPRSLPYLLRRWRGRVCSGGLRLTAEQDKTTKGMLWRSAPI
jgi:cation transport regulator ChaC